MLLYKPPAMSVNASVHPVCEDCEVDLHIKLDLTSEVQ